MLRNNMGLKLSSASRQLISFCIAMETPTGVCKRDGKEYVNAVVL